MISLRIGLNDIPATNGKPGNNYHSITKNNLTLDYKLGRLYGFVNQLEDYFVCGESIFPQNNNSKGDNLKRLIEPSYDFTKVGNDYQTLLIIDSKEQKIKLYSNISSSRTCYYSFNKNCFLCSSSVIEMQQFIDKLEMNDDVISEFMAYRYVTPPKTLFKNINKLILGQFLEIDLRAKTIISDSLYKYSSVLPDNSSSEFEAGQKLLDILGTYITDCASNSDNPGLLLSGGLDSSLLGVLSSRSVKNIKSFSSSFDFVDSSDYENVYAQSVANFLAIEHNVYKGTKVSYLKGLVDSIYYSEEPIHHLQSVMLYKIFAECAAPNCDIIFCGEGADMMFGNVLHSKINKYQNLISLLQRTGGNKLLNLFLKMINCSDEKWKFFTRDFDDNYLSNNHILYTIQLFGDTNFLRKHMDFKLNDIFRSHKELANIYNHRNLYDLITIMSQFTAGFIAASVWNKLAEKNNITIIYPFLTKELTDYILTVPWDQKLKENKYFIRQMLRVNDFPEEFVTRPKLSFGFPFKYWATKGALFQPIVEMMYKSYDKKLLDRIQTEEPKLAMILWNLINLFIWHKLFIDNVSCEDLTGEIIDRHLILSKKR